MNVASVMLISPSLSTSPSIRLSALTETDIIIAIQSDKDKTRSEWSDKTADMLRKELGTEKLEIIRRNTHDKFIFCDDEYYLEGSFNLLSFDGDYSRKDQRHEHMTLSYDKELLQRYKAEYFS